VGLTHTREGVEVDLSTCDVSYKILDAKTRQELYPIEINSDPSVLLVPSSKTFQLDGIYDLRVYIDDAGFVDVLSIKLTVL
jgi:hypothetical protein